MASNNSADYQPIQHAILVGSSNNGITSLARGNSGQTLQSAGSSSDPGWTTATYPSTAGTSGNLLTSDGTNFISQASSGGSVLSVVTGGLTNSQIKNLHGTPIQIIAAPGSGKVVVPVCIAMTLNYGGTNAFTASASQAIQLYWGTSELIGTGLSNANITKTSSYYEANMAVRSIPAAISFSNANNAAVNLYNVVATEISGNAANNNTMSYIVAYYTFTP